MSSQKLYSLKVKTCFFVLFIFSLPQLNLFAQKAHLDVATLRQQTTNDGSGESFGYDSTIRDLIVANERDKQLYLTLLAIALIIIIVIVVFFLINTRKQSAALQRQNKIIRSKHKEIENLMRESHHRIKNNLQLVSSILKLQGKNVRSAKTKEAILEARNRIKTIALMHENFQAVGSLEEIELNEFIEQLINNLRQSLLRSDSDIIIHTELEAINMLSTNSLSVGLILNELVTNSLKYAFANNQGDIWISLCKTEDSIIIQVKDNGNGIKDGVDLLNGPSLGFQIITTLADKLNGKLSVKNGEGLQVSIKIPYD